jgi:hypothetical protein
MNIYNNIMRTIVYVDMDDVLADFKTGIEKLSQEK